MTCAMCGSLGCPYCRGAIPTIHSGHRLPLEDFRCPQERSPVRSNAVICSPADCLRTDQITGRSSDHRVNVISGHHAPDTAQGVMANAEILVSQNRKP
jgi:hypothetical protein